MNIKKLLFIVFTSLLPIGAIQGQTLTYVLLPGSTIAPAVGANLTGPEEPLTGTFTWTFVPSNSNSTIFAFNVTSLNMESANYTFSGSTQDWLDETETNGVSTFYATTNATGEVSGSYELAGYEGTFQGSPSAPTQLSFAAGLAPAPQGGLFVAQLSIQAQLVPEPSTWGMLLVSLWLLAFWRIRSHRIVS